MSDEIILVDATGPLIAAHFKGGDALARELVAEIAAGWLEFPDALDAMRKDYGGDPAPRVAFAAGTPIG